MKMKKVGVTGGSGFIGRYVCEELLMQNYIPVIFDHHAKDEVEYPRGVEFFLGDVRDEVAMTEFAAHVDGIIHLAAVLGTQETVKNPRPAAQSNLMGGLNFLEACAQYDIPGTYIAVGNWWFNNPYSITKNMIERFVEMYNKDRGTRINIVRAVNAYGPRQLAATPFGTGKVRKITPAFVCRALSGQDIEVYGDGEQVSDMVYVGDVAVALVKSLEYAARGRVIGTVEIGSKDHTTVNHVAELVRNISHDRLERPLVEIKHLPMRPGEKVGDKVTADVSTLKKIGMSPNNLVSLEVGLLDTINYFATSEGISWNAPSQ